MNDKSICIVGDLNVDIVTHLPDLTSIPATQDTSEQALVEQRVGGTAFNLGRGAKQVGFAQVAVIGKVGVQNGQLDIGAQFIASALQEQHITYALAHDAELATGQIMMVYFGDRRLMVSGRGANASFSQADITEDIRAVVYGSNILFVSGYWLLNPVQAEAVLQLMTEAADHGCLVVFDVVPHKIFRYVTVEDFRRYTKPVHVFVSEHNTIKRLFPEFAQCEFDEYEAEICERLFSVYDALIIRLSNQREYIVDRRGIIYKGSTGFSEAQGDEKRGFLDRLAIKRIYDNYERFMTSRQDELGKPLP